MAVTLVSSCVCGKLHKTGPASISSWIEQMITWPHPSLRNYQQCMVAGRQGVTFFSGVATHKLLMSQ